MPMTGAHSPPRDQIVQLQCLDNLILTLRSPRLDSDRRSPMFPAHDRARAVYGLDHEAQARRGFPARLENAAWKSRSLRVSSRQHGWRRTSNPTPIGSMPFDHVP